jgi:DNA-binding transcriptional MerR regulator
MVTNDVSFGNLVKIVDDAFERLQFICDKLKAASVSLKELKKAVETNKKRKAGEVSNGDDVGDGDHEANEEFDGSDDEMSDDDTEK